MPQIPQYNQQTSASGGSLGPAPSGDLGFSAVAALGRDLQQDAQRRQQYSVQVQEENSLVVANDELQSARSDWSQKITERKQSAPAGAAGFTKQALEDFDVDAKARIGRASTQRAREYLRERLGQVRLGIQEDAQAFEIGSGTRDKVAKIDSAVDKARVATELRPQDFEQIHGEQLIAIANSGLPEQERIARAKDATESLARSAVAGMIRLDPVAALKELQNEKTENPAVSLLDATTRHQLAAAAKERAENLQVETATVSIAKAFEQGPRSGQAALAQLPKTGLTEIQQLEVRRGVNSANGLLHAERREQYSDQVNVLERAIAAGAPGQDAELQASKLYGRGVYTPDQYTNVLQAIDAARAKGAADGIESASVQDAIANGERLDPKNEKVVKAVDKWFTAAADTNHVTRGSDEWINSAAAIANRTNILPPSAMAWARKTILSGEPALAVPAANAMSRWADAAPTAYAYFDDPNMKAQAEQIDGLVRAGVAPANAVEIARKNTFDIPPARKQALAADYTKQKYAGSNAGELQSFMNSDDSFDREILPNAPVPSVGMRDEYSALVRTYFDSTNGDIQRARDLAWKDIRGVYGYSTVNGAPEILKYAPELVFPGIDPKVIRSDVDAAAAGAGVKTPVRLVPSRTTGDTHGLIWELQTTDADGNAEVLLDDKNRPLQYAIPTDTAKYVEAQENAKRQAVDAARADSKKRRELAELTLAPGYEGY